MGLLGFISDLFSATYKDEKGYLRYKNTNKLVHRVVAEKKLGRKLLSGEVVHHKDRNKTNNSMDNLWIFRNQAEHDRIHDYDAWRHGKVASYQGFKEPDRSWIIVLIVVLIAGLIILRNKYTATSRVSMCKLNQ